MSKNTLRGEAVNWNTELRSYGAFQEPKKTLKTVKKPQYIEAVAKVFIKEEIVLNPLTFTS